MENRLAEAHYRLCIGEGIFLFLSLVPQFLHKSWFSVQVNYLRDPIGEAIDDIHRMPCIAIHSLQGPYTRTMALELYVRLVLH